MNVLLKTALSLLPPGGAVSQLVLVLHVVFVVPVQCRSVAERNCGKSTNVKTIQPARAKRVSAAERRQIATERRSPSPQLRRTIHFSKPLPCHLSSTEEWQGAGPELIVTTLLKKLREQHPTHARPDPAMPR